MESTEFPEMILETLGRFFVTLEGVEAVTMRSVTHLDKGGTLGIDVDAWQPSIFELGDPGGFEPSVSYYVLSIQHLTKNERIEEGRRIHRSVAKSIRTMLYSDRDLQVALAALADTSGTRPLRILRWVVDSQEFGSTEIDSKFVSLSVTNVTFDIQQR